VIASHELIEMLGDPEINLTIFNQTRINGGQLYAYEFCDACEADQYGYKIGLVLVSDFVLPTWFQPSWPSKAYDFMSHLHGPVPTLLPGGYIGVFPIPNRHGWAQIEHADQGFPGMRKAIGAADSRRAKRCKAKDQLIRSTAL
jgi:hypothetical protein